MTPEEITERHGATDCTCLRDGAPCSKCRMLTDDIREAIAEEREACAQLAEGPQFYCFTGPWGEYNCSTPDKIADAIRARKSANQ